MFPCSCGIVNLHPLTACTELEALVLPPNAKDIEFLRALPKLQMPGYAADSSGGWTTTAATQFRKDYDARQAAGKKRACAGTARGPPVLPELTGNGLPNRGGQRRSRK